METEKRTYEEAVDIMVKWWSEKAFDTLLNQNNGDNSPDGGIVWALMNTVSMQAQNTVTSEKKQKFEKKLTEILLNKKGLGRWHNELDVDYHPNDNLYQACKFAGINTLCLPCKTFTFIDKDNSVQGRYQYGGAWFKI